MEIVESFLGDLNRGDVPIAAALGWLKELRREGLYDLAAQIESRWPRVISTVSQPIA